MYKEIENYFDRLWPICRSITGEGFLKSLEILKELVPLTNHSVKSGTPIFDWTVPKVWNIRDAYILDPNGKKIVDLQKNNLHVLNYSAPINKRVTLEELQEHLYTRPELPDAIPYVTSYYKERWGFCLTENQRKSLQPGKYTVFVDSSLEEGELNYGMATLKASSDTDKEILISTYLCHPSMANNELSGPLVSSFLYRELQKIPNRNYNYRFVFVPETIGSLCFLNDYGDHLRKNCFGGFVVTCCGDDGQVTFKKSREEKTLTNFHTLDFLKGHKEDVKIKDFFPTGSDERQYCSPGFNLPIGSITRSMYGEYKEYHTSQDNKEFISFKAMQESVNIYKEIILKMDRDSFYLNLNPNGEPMLGKRSIYPSLGASRNPTEEVTSMNYLLNYSDGKHSLEMISSYSGISQQKLKDLAERLIDKGLMLKI